MKHTSKGMSKPRFLALLMTFIMVLAMLPTAAFAEEAPTSEDSGADESSYIMIDSVEDLQAISQNLSADYKLSANIDLSGVENWTPIGSFEADETVNDGETPNEAYAFTGTFDGEGHTISGLNVSSPIGAGLFGCVAGGTVKDLTVEDVTVSGSCMAAAVIGYAYNSTVDGVTLTASENKTNTITGSALNYQGYEMAPNMVAGIVGAGMDSNIKNCTVNNTNLNVTGLSKATAWGENVHDIGLLGGGLESTSLENCTVTDSTINITGAYTFGIGGLSGCAMEADKVEGCTVSGVTITLGDNAYLTGGLVGYSGQGKGKTALSDCKTENVTINVGEASSHIGGMIGGGFYLSGERYRAVYPVPTSFDITGATVFKAAITTGNNSTALGLVAGQAYQSTIDGAMPNGTINGEAASVCGLSEGKDIDFLYALSETYQPLFEDATFEEGYNHYWEDYAAAVVGKNAAKENDAAGMMKRSIGADSSVIGKTDVSEDEAAFCCAFTNGIARLSFHGSVITGYDDDDDVVFSHSYKYLRDGHLYGPNPENPEEQIPYMNLTIFETDDADSGEFKYFAMCDDTPSTTYHIEFRYGSELNDLKNDNDLEQMYTGKYAYWLAAGIPTSADETMISNVIALFCAENLAEMTTAETVSQRAELVGTWNGSEDSLVFATDGSVKKGADEGVFYAYDGKLITMIDDVCTAYKYTISGRTLTLYTVDGEKIATYTKPSSSHGHGSSSGKTTTKTEEPKQEETTQPTQETPKQTIVTMQIGSKILFVNSVAAEKDAAPVIRNDRTLVPIRFITESLGGAAAWNGATKEVTLTIDGREIKLTIGKTLEKYGVAPVIIGERTYVPVRFVADELGAATAWDDATKTVTITKSEE